MNRNRSAARCSCLLRAALLAACSAAPGAGSPPAAPTTMPTSAPQGAPTTAPAAGGSEPAYLDDRSNARALLDSFYNAINRHEYVRAYSYWQEQTELPPLPAFTEGYSTTASVVLTTGDVLSDEGAGQRNYSVPVTIAAHMNDGSTQTFAGCYFLHLAIPAAQEPPFQPLGIVHANVQPVTASARAETLMRENCRATR